MTLLNLKLIIVIIIFTVVICPKPYVNPIPISLKLKPPVAWCAGDTRLALSGSTCFGGLVHDQNRALRVTIANSMSRALIIIRGSGVYDTILMELQGVVSL